jgi:hypothetical protein
MMADLRAMTPPEFQEYLAALSRLVGREGAKVPGTD